MSKPMADAPPDYNVQYTAHQQQPSAGYGYNPSPQQYAQPMQPVHAQPSNVNVVVTQPAAKQVNFVDPRNYPLPRDWNTGVLGCFDDIGDCVLTWCCSPCKLCMAANDMNESVFIVCCTPTPLMSMRTKVRMMYGIQGSICGDCITTTFCPLCAQCQMQRQLKTPCQCP